MSFALAKLREAQQRTGSLLSVGLEPCPEYLAPGITANASGYKSMLRTVIHATQDQVCAYKLNLAFFEALGPEGWQLLYSVRKMIPEDALVIADAKRSDIGSSAQRYAFALYDRLRADAATVNPLMGHDSVEPFARYTNKLTFLLCLTSNPGAADFLGQHGLAFEIARRSREWAQQGNLGLVVGATNPEAIRGLREAAGPAPFLVPGIGAQGGEVEPVLANGWAEPGGFSGLILHVTRGILPDGSEPGDPREIIHNKTADLNARVARAVGL